MARGPGDHGDHGGRSYSSLGEALNQNGIPVENHAAISEVVAYVGIRSYRGTSSYIVAERIGAGPALQIAYGWTNGFMSKEEAVAAGGGRLECWPSERGSGQWGLTHPQNRLYERSSTGFSRANAERPVCPVCHLTLPNTGRCDDCD